MATNEQAPGTGLPPSYPRSMDDEDLNLSQLLEPALRRWRLCLAVTLIAGAVGAAGSYLMTPQFTSTATFLPPQQQQSSAASALASLGGLAALGLGGVKSPAEEYISLMRSVTVGDRMIERFQLMKVYKKKYRADARKTLEEQSLITLGKKDGLISVAVEDADPKRAADMANQFIEELRHMTSVLAVSEAQQRRVFFEKQMQETKVRLVAAQTALQQSGFTAGAIKAEPQAAAQQYAQLRAQATAADIKLQTLRTSLAESAPELMEQATLVSALRSKLAQLEASTRPGDAATSDYVSRFREFKYQETLFELLSKQYELARVDESREGALIQVVDPAQPAERKSKPTRSLIAAGAALVAAIAMAAGLIIRAHRRPAAQR